MMSLACGGNMRPVLVGLILLAQLLTPIAFAAENPTDSADLNGYDESEQELFLRYRTAHLVPLEEWNGPTEGSLVVGHDYPVPTDWHPSLEQAGFDCGSFLPPAAFHCNIPSGLSLSDLADLDVSGLMILDEVDKVHKDIFRALDGKGESQTFFENGGLIDVMLTGKVLPQGRDLIVINHQGRFATMMVSSEDVYWLAKQQEIEWIEPMPVFYKSNNVADGIINSTIISDNAIMSAIDSSWTGLDGSGVIVAIADSGLDNGINNSNMHDDFKDHILDITSLPIDSSWNSLVDNPGADDGASDLESGHGTHVAGSVLGDGTASSGSIKGVAPEARLYFQAIEQYTDWNAATQGSSDFYTDGYKLTGIPSNLDDLFKPAWENGSRVHSNSWGGGTAGEYNLRSAHADKAAREYSNMTILFAAGNDGVDGNSDGEIDEVSLGPPGTAKNVITVGASENYRPSISYKHFGTVADEWGELWSSDYPAVPISTDKMADNPQGMAAFSSRGPVDDTRIKPDISAPGSFILSTRSSLQTEDGWGTYDADYFYSGGTSMACPLTAGAAALLIEHLMKHKSVPDPTSDLVKGIIIASAWDMTGQYGVGNGASNAAPNVHEGWGLVNLSKAVKTSFVTNQSVRTGDKIGLTFNVPINSPDMRLTLSWIDPESTPGALYNLVNNLDIHVKDPSGTWTNTTDDRNNIISLDFANPAQGIWEVHVNGTSVPGASGAPQFFSVVNSNGYLMSNMSSDTDFDGVEDDDDDCPTVWGSSSANLEGCPDSDLDTWADSEDWAPLDNSQWADADADGYGDETGGTNGDDCPGVTGFSSLDRRGCPDGDSDGYSDPDAGWTTSDGADACDAVGGTSTNPVNGCPDSDGDTWADSSDLLPNDSSQWADSDGDGFGDNPDGTNGDDCPGVNGDSTVDRRGCTDTDGDGWSDEGDAFPGDPNEHADTDLDGIADGVDDCPSSPGLSTIDRQGCPDPDGDGYSTPTGDWTVEDGADALPLDPTQYQDQDGDGYGDDAAGNKADDCPSIYGKSWQNGVYGCYDADKDGWADANDEMPNDMTQWADTDGDGYGDNPGGTNPDACPDEAGTSNQGGWFGCIDSDGDGWANLIDGLPDEPDQWNDTDGDGWGDNLLGNKADNCPFEYGESTVYPTGCPDSDGDGVTDIYDPWPNDPTKSVDTDSDGIANSTDDCPEEWGTSTIGKLGCPDADGDGYPDSEDAFPNDPDLAADADGDGAPDGIDDCPGVVGSSLYDVQGCIDTDGDGWSDSGDMFPNNASEWNDTDSDGFGDNRDGCINTPGTSWRTPEGCIDSDSDGMADTNDPWPHDDTRWGDSDGDGLDDIIDKCVNQAGSAWRGARIGCPDSDGDGYADIDDLFPDEITQWLDSDGDGYGDNQTSGAKLVDYWPSDASKNSVDASLTCDADTIKAAVNGDFAIHFTCSITNKMSVEIAVLIQWDVTDEIYAKGTSRLAVIQPGDTMTISFNGIAQEAGTYRTYVRIIQPGETDSNKQVEITVAVSDDTPEKFEVQQEFFDVSDTEQLLGAIGYLSVVGFFVYSWFKGVVERRRERRELLVRARLNRIA